LYLKIQAAVSSEITPSENPLCTGIQTVPKAAIFDFFIDYSS
jgi:hypothetical protein